MSIIDKKVCNKHILILFLIVEILLLILSPFKIIILLAPFIPIIIYAFYRVVRGEVVKYRTLVLPVLFGSVIFFVSFYILIFYDQHQYIYWRRIIGLATVFAFLYVFINSFFITGPTDKNHSFINGSLLVKQINTLYFFYFGLMSILIYLDFLGHSPDISALLLNPRPLMSVAVVFSMILKIQIIKKVETNNSMKHIFEIPTSHQLENYKTILQDYLVTNKLYLQHNLGKEVLSRKTNIPLKHLDYLFDNYLERDFHHFIAKYRIGYAIELMLKNGDKYTLSAISFESGFRSRATFNKYFKVYTGHLPSEYLIKARRS